MGQESLVPFYSLIASMLLVKNEVTSVDIVNTMSRLEHYGTNIDADDDDIELLECCVEVDDDFSFCLKDNYTLDTVLDNGMTVEEFLTMHSNCKINMLLHNELMLNYDSYYDDNYNVKIKPKVKVRSLFKGIGFHMF